MNSKLSGIKNLIWGVFITLAVAGIVVGLCFAIFTKYYGDKQDFNLNLNNTSSGTAGSSSTDNGSGLAEIGTGSSAMRGTLNILNEVPDAGSEYVNRLTFLVDSTFIGLRDLSIVDTNQVWGTTSGSLPIGTASEALIKFPNDGSEISAANAAMVAKPAILVIGIGTDGLADVDETAFETQYDTLIRDILLASPDTQIICCGLPSIGEQYSGKDGLTVTVVSDGNDWVKNVCRDTGAYFLDVQETLSESCQLLARYASSNGKSLNRAGLQTFLEYMRTHALQ